MGWGQDGGKQEGERRERKKKQLFSRRENKEPVSGGVCVGGWVKSFQRSCLILHGKQEEMTQSWLAISKRIHKEVGNAGNSSYQGKFRTYISNVYKSQLSIQLPSIRFFWAVVVVPQDPQLVVISCNFYCLPSHPTYTNMLYNPTLQKSSSSSLRITTI